MTQPRPSDSLCVEKTSGTNYADGNHPLRCRHASRRWATAVTTIISLEADPRTIDAWAHAIGVSCGTLKNWCHAIGVRPKTCLDLARLLRATTLCAVMSSNPFDLLDIIDRRTLDRLFGRAGLERTDLRVAPLELLQRQRLVIDQGLLEELAKSVASRNPLITKDHPSQSGDATRLRT
jgi:hypothetical protein